MGIPHGRRWSRTRMRMVPHRGVRVLFSLLTKNDGSNDKNKNENENEEQNENDNEE